MENKTFRNLKIGDPVYKIVFSSPKHRIWLIRVKGIREGDVGVFFIQFSTVNFNCSDLHVANEIDSNVCGNYFLNYNDACEKLREFCVKKIIIFSEIIGSSKEKEEKTDASE